MYHLHDLNSKYILHYNVMDLHYYVKVLHYYRDYHDLHEMEHN